jgi:transportin-3
MIFPTVPSPSYRPNRKVIEDFFRLLMDALYCHPMEFTKSSLLPGIVQAALGSLALELENPLTAVLHFLRDLLGYAVGHVPSAMEANILPEMEAIIRGMINANGSALCSRIMSGMIFTFPRDCVMDGAGALMTLIEMDPQASVAWIRESLNMLPPKILSANELLTFIHQIQEYTLSSRQLLTTSAADSRDYRKIQCRIQHFVAILSRRAIFLPPGKVRKLFGEGVISIVSFFEGRPAFMEMWN